MRRDMHKPHFWYCLVITADIDMLQSAFDRILVTSDWPSQGARVDYQSPWSCAPLVLVAQV